MDKEWTIEDVEKNIKTNVTDYGSMVVTAFLFKKLYGRLPKCGMSGAQAEFADSVVRIMPAGVNNG